MAGFLLILVQVHGDGAAVTGVGDNQVDAPSGVELKPGDKVTATDGDGNKSTGTVGTDAGKCAAAAVGFGLPLLVLLPIGLATQMQFLSLFAFVA